MSARIAGLELRRTMVPAIVVALLLVARALAADGMNPTWPGLVDVTILGYRDNLLLLWPLAAAIGAGVGYRDRAARVAELFDTTPRRPWVRLAPRAALLGAGLGVAYLLAPADILARAALDGGTYWPAAWPWPLLVGGLGMVAAGLLGLALGRSLRAAALVPAVAVAGVVLAFFADVAGRHGHSRALLLLPTSLDAATPDGGDFTVVDWRTNAGQAIWFVALAAAGYLLYSRPRRGYGRPRRAVPLTAVVVLAGLVSAIAALPPADRATRRDAGAAALVCADGLPRVCVTRVYAKVLPDLVGPAREALRALGRLPDPPSALLQDTGDFGMPGRQPADSVMVRLTVDGDGRLVTGVHPMVDELLDGAGTLRCERLTDRATEVRVMAARAVAAAWLLDRAGPPAAYGDDDRTAVAEAWAALHRLSPQEQVTRVAALRAAGLHCRDDVYQVLVGTG